ncbi:MAG: sugar phosphate isomerase/epimerase family protein [Caldicoprobacterales bacterium]|jgi:sugar phosphate isomerase/epimerase|nr:sugar phosphate isomerase/epimerase [Clostridiales bacterium]
MNYPKIAAQLYTIRDFCKTSQDIRESLKRVKQIGYDAVQVSGIGPIGHEEMKEFAEEAGLVICATHIGFDRIKDQIDDVIKQHKLWNCKYVGVGGMPIEYRDSGEGFKAFAKEASKYARILKDNGLQFIYHNHSFEFQKFNGVTGMDILFEESDPEVFQFELDTYWVQHGGADPVYWIDKVAGRMDVVHFKDMVILNNKQEQFFAEIGEGNLNWKGITEACARANVKWAAVEQDRCRRDPFESLAISRKNLKDMGL